VAVEVRRANLTDRAAINAFIQANYGDLASFKGPARWEWQFVQNPAREDAAADKATVWIAVDGDVVVGQIAVQSTEVKIDDRTLTGGWIVDVMISPSHRGLGLGHRLHAAAHAETPLLLTLTMAPATRRIAERAGALTLLPTYQYSRWRAVMASDVRRYFAARFAERPLLRALAKSVFMLSKLDYLCSLAIRLVQDRRSAVAADRFGIDFIEVERFGREIDAFWESAKHGYPAICPRTSRFLNWRFSDCPELSYRRFTAMRDGRPAGYLVLRRTEAVELRQGIIVDAFVHREDSLALKAMLRFAQAEFGDDVATIECGASSGELQRALREERFIRARTHHPTIVVADAEMRACAVALRDDWYFTKADHDWDQVHLG
jgi:GNAT superfamily N-acetyltransferase